MVMIEERLGYEILEDTCSTRKNLLLITSLSKYRQDPTKEIDAN